MDQKTFVYGVISGAIGSILAVWFLFLLKHPAQAVWKRITTPGPLTLAQKVQIAEQIRTTKITLERLNHMAANSKDLYLYLFQLSLTGLLCVSGALFTLLLVPSDPHFAYSLERRSYLITPYMLLVTILMAFGVLFCAIALWEAKRMSAQNIDRTRETIERTLADLTEKLGMPAA